MTDRAMSGLPGTAVAALRRALEHRDVWSFDHEFGCDGDAFALATHEPTGTTIVMFGDSRRIELSELRDDRLWPLVHFDRLEAAVEFMAGESLRDLLGAGAPAFC